MSSHHHHAASKPLCLVRSSINIDQIFAVPHVVRPGETLSSSSMQARPGGKGANVSAAIALAGQHVMLSGAVGKEAEWPIDHLHERGVDVKAIRVLDSVPTGRAFIQVAKDGENSIVLVKGANFFPDEHADDPAKVFASHSHEPTHLIVQNEIPLETTQSFLRYAHAGNRQCVTIFNPSPMLTAEELEKFPWSDIDVLIVNEGEAQDLLEAMHEKTEGDPLEGLSKLPALGSTSWIVMTRGSRGVSAMVRPIHSGTTATASGNRSENTDRERIEVAAAKPHAVRDTTGAGDTFAGNLVAGLMRHHEDQSSIESARGILQFAAVAAALAVERDGAMESIPRLADVQKREKSLLSG